MDRKSWKKVSGGFQLPRDTLILGEIISSYETTDFEKNSTTLVIIDAARLGGENVQEKPFETR